MGFCLFDCSLFLFDFFPEVFEDFLFFFQFFVVFDSFYTIYFFKHLKSTVWLFKLSYLDLETHMLYHMLSYINMCFHIFS